MFKSHLSYYKFFIFQSKEEGDEEEKSSIPAVTFNYTNTIIGSGIIGKSKYYSINMSR